MPRTSRSATCRGSMIYYQKALRPIESTVRRSGARSIFFSVLRGSCRVNSFVVSRRFDAVIDKLLVDGKELHASEWWQWGLKSTAE